MEVARLARTRPEKINLSSKINELPQSLRPIHPTMGKKGKRGDKPAEKKALLKRLDALAKKLEEELKGADLFAPIPPTEE